MEKDVIMWIIGIVVGVLSLGMGWLITSHIGLLQDVATLKADGKSVKELIEMVGIKVAMRMHSPHTPEFDALAEEYQRRKGELEIAQWDRLREFCSQLEADETEPGEKRALASIMEAFARHKLESYMKLPPQVLRKH